MAGRALTSGAIVVAVLFVSLGLALVAWRPERPELLQLAVVPGEELVEAATQVSLARPRRMFLWKRPAPLELLHGEVNVRDGSRSTETIMPGSLEIDPGQLGAGVGGGSDEMGQCFADASCGISCVGCPQCQCLMDDGR